MSLFGDDLSAIKKAVLYFESLPEAEKALIVSNLAPASQTIMAHIQHLDPLLYAIQRDIGEHDEIKIGNQLQSLGMQNTYARLFVENIKKHAPTIEFMTREIDRISDDDFKTELPKLIQNLWLGVPDTDVIKNSKFPDMTPFMITLVRNIMNTFLSGSSIDYLMNVKYKINMSPSKIDTFKNQIQINKPHWRESVMYGTMIESINLSRQIHGQNQQILNLMEHVLNSLQSDKKSNSSA